MCVQVPACLQLQQKLSSVRAIEWLCLHFHSFFTLRRSWNFVALKIASPPFLLLFEKDDWVVQEISIKANNPL